MPKPKKGETKQEYVSRCVIHLAKKGEGKNNDQRVAICYSLWDQHKGGKK